MLPADPGGVRQIACAHHRAVVVVALHRAVGGGDHRGADAVARARAHPDETVGCEQRGAGAGPFGLGAFRIGDLGVSERRGLGLRRLARERLGVGLHAIVQIERRQLAGDLIGVGKPDVRILRDRFRDGDRMLDQLGEPRRGEVAGGDDRLAPADEHAKAQIAAFGALDVLELAQAPGRRLAAALDQQHIGGIGAGLRGARQDLAQEVDRVFGIGHRQGSPEKALDLVPR
jgi:hypothetical protein